MWLRKRILIFYILSATGLIVLLSVLHKFLPYENGSYNFNFENFNNSNPSKFDLIPNVVHYVLFNKTSIDFVTYLSILSVIKIQNPLKIQIHSDVGWLSGFYWDKVKQINTNTTIKVSFLQKPTHVYGQPLSSIYHSTDVARIQVLRWFGGIYLDSDVLVLNNMNKLRHFEMVVGLPKGDYMGTQILLANKNARFLRLWLEGYQHYQPRDWYYNAGRVPTKILQDFPFLAHRQEDKFGVQNLLDKLHSDVQWNEWKGYYTVHLLSRHEPTPKDLDEQSVQKLKTNFGHIAKWILDLE